MKVTELKVNYVYKMKQGDEAVFKHIGQTGMPIFHPVGEPSFQDVFGVTDPETNVICLIRPATAEDMGCD